MRLSGFEIKINNSSAKLNDEGTEIKLEHGADRNTVISELKNITEKETAADSVSFVVEHATGEKTFVISILKQKDSFDLRLNGDPSKLQFAEVITNSLALNFDKKNWETRFINLGDFKADPIEGLYKKLQESGKLFTKVSSEDLRKDELQTLTQVNGDIKNLEQKIETYKKLKEDKEVVEQQVQKLTAEIKQQEEKLQGSESLVATVQRIESEIAKFGKISQIPNLEQAVQQIKRSRISKLISILKSLKQRLGFGSNNIAPKTNPSEESTFLLGGVMLIQILATAGIFVVTSNFAVLAFGILISLIMGLLVVYSIIASTHDNVKVSAAKRNNLNLVSYDQINSSFDRNENVFLVNSAWVDALKKEHQKAIDTLNAKLGGVDYRELVRDLSNKRQVLTELARKVFDLDIARGSAEDYLKNRRELDLLILERDSLEEGLENEFVTLMQSVDVPVFVYNINEVNGDMKQESEEFIEELREMVQIVAIN